MDVPNAPRGAPLTRRHLLAAALGTLGGLPRAQAAEPGHVWRPWPAEAPVPAMVLPTLDGRPWRLADQRGKVVLANFWASWCGPCRVEMPSLANLAERRADDGLVVVAVNYREGPSTIRRFVESLGLELTVLRDGDGEAARAWTPRMFPSTVFIDRRGQPAGVLVGEIDWEGPAARALVDPLLAGRPERA